MVLHWHLIHSLLFIAIAADFCIHFFEIRRPVCPPCLQEISQELKHRNSQLENEKLYLKAEIERLASIQEFARFQNPMKKLAFSLPLEEANDGTAKNSSIFAEEAAFVVQDHSNAEAVNEKFQGEPHQIDNPFWQDSEEPDANAFDIKSAFYTIDRTLDKIQSYRHRAQLPAFSLMSPRVQREPRGRRLESLETALLTWALQPNETLNLAGSNLEGSIPAWIGNFTNITVLDLSGNALSGEIPDSLGNLRRLQQLNLASNKLSGNIPSRLGELTDLQLLRLDGNLLAGTIPESLANLNKLEELRLSQNQLSGSMPSLIGNLSSLRNLWLQENKLSGQLDWILSLPAVQQLQLYMNEFSGEIPKSIGSLSQLQILMLDMNKLSGELPESLGNLEMLQQLLMSENALSGSIPSSLGRLKNLLDLGLSSNQLSGSIPVTLCDLQALIYLDFRSNNLSDVVPSCIGNVTQLQYLLLTGNRLSGNIPPSLGNLSSVVYFNLDQNLFSGSIPQTLCGLTSALDFRLHENKLEGSIPTCIGDLSSVSVLYLAVNLLSGSIPDSVCNMSQLTFLVLENNRLSGNIPTCLGDLSQLTVLGLSLNLLSGHIPESLGKLQYLTNLLLDNNKLAGIIPSSIGSLTSLLQILLEENQLSGPLPSSMGNLINLQTLTLFSNQLSGHVPSSFGYLTNLTELKLGKNQLSGPIPEAFGNMISLKVLLLADNLFDESIPSSLGNLTQLSELYLSNNKLQGVIPDLSQTCLTTLEASFNKLSGLTSFNETTLVKLDLSFNKLTDVNYILYHLPELRYLNLAHNHIVEWPRAGVLPRKSLRLRPGFRGASLSLVPRYADQIALKKVLTLNVSSNPIWVNSTEPDYDALAFLCSLAILPQLTVLDASDCHLSGDIPFIVVSKGLSASQPGLFDFLVDASVFPNLAFLSLSRNNIYQIGAPLPKSLLVADLSDNELGVVVDPTRPVLHPSWLLQLRQLDVSQNPKLRLVVSPPNVKLGCSTNSSLDTLIADSSAFRMLTQAEASLISSNTNWQVDVEGVECTSPCRPGITDLTLDFGMLNLTSLCRCKPGWTGSDAYCKPCSADRFSVVQSFGRANVCKSCPANSTTFGLTGKSSILDCKCQKGMYMNASSGLLDSLAECRPCALGSFSQDPGSINQCGNCPAGTVSSSVGATACKECPEGQFAFGAFKCLECPAGKFQSNKAQTECSSCFPGTYSRAGSVLCTPCPKGTYQSVNGSSFCSPCPEGFETTEIGSENRSHCICPRGSYLKNDTCLKCTEGMLCSGGSDLFSLLPGFYSSEPIASLIFKCAADDRSARAVCAGGSPFASGCLGKRNGFLCQECPLGQTSNKMGDCEACSAEDTLKIIVIFLSGVLLVIALVVFAIRSPIRQLPQTADIKSIAAQIICAIQILAAIESLGVEWSDPFNNFLGILRVFSLDLDVIRIRCVVRSDVFGNYMLRLSVPLIGLTCLAIAGLIMNLIKKARVVTLNTVINAGGQIFVAAYISICLVTVAVFHCFSHPNDRTSLVVYPSILCWEGGLHTSMLGYSIVCILVYVAGLFAMVAFAIWKYPKAIMRDSLNFIRRFGFLFNNWSTTCYWFSGVLLARNLFVAILPKIIAPEYNHVTLVLIQAVLLIHLCFVLLYLPWRTLTLNFLEIMLCVVFQVVIAGGIISTFKPDVSDAVSKFLFALCILAFLTSLTYILMRIWSLYGKPQKWAFFISHHKAGGACTARYLKTVLAKRLNREIFYDSDNLNDLSGIVSAVKMSECILVLMTGETLCRPWCAAEIITAAEIGVPFLPCTVCNAPGDSREVKDRYQTLNSDGLANLLGTFEILKPHGINVDYAPNAFDLLLSMPFLHFNLLEGNSIDAKVDLLATVLSACAKPSRLRFGRKAPNEGTTQDAVNAVVISNSARTAMSATSQVWEHAKSMRMFNVLTSVPHQGRRVEPAVFDESDNNKWLIMTDHGDFEATAAGRYVKMVLQASIRTEIALDIEFSTTDLAAKLGSFSVCLWFLTVKTLSSAPQISRLALVKLLKPEATVKPVLITDAFRFPDETFYQKLLSTGGSFGPDATEVFSDEAGQDLTLEQVVSALKAVFQNISTFVHVPVASEQMLQTSIAQMVERMGGASTVQSQRKEAWSADRASSKPQGKEADRASLNSNEADRASLNSNEADRASLNSNEAPADNNEELKAKP